MPAILVSFIDIVLFLGALFFLAKATQMIIGALNEFSRSSKVEIFAIAGLFSAVATSLPELFVGLSSALAGNSQLVLGMVLGSNIANVTLVIGSVAVVSGGLAVVGDFVKKDILKSFLILVFPLILLLDGALSRADGLLLLIAFASYHFTMFYSKRQSVASKVSKPVRSFGRWLHSFNKNYDKKQIGWFVLGIAMLLFSANMVVQIGAKMALDFQIPIILIGLLFVAIGTSLPELALEIRAAKQGQTSAVFGDLIGSLIANSTLILGLVALIQPIRLNGNEPSVLTAGFIFLFAFSLLWVFIRTKLKLQRWEGFILLGVYVIFIILEYLLATTI